MLPRCPLPPVPCACSKRDGDGEKMQAALVHPTPLITSASDTRAYRRDSSGQRPAMRAVSDPSTDKAAAMTVQVGISQTHSKCPASRILSSMCFQGSRDFPKCSPLKKWLSDHGGSSNASTSMDRTNFFFDVTHLISSRHFAVSLVSSQRRFSTRMQSQKN